MAPRPPKSLRLPRPAWHWLLPALLLAGCGTNRASLDRAVLSAQGGPRRNQGVAERYCLHFPDAIMLTVEGRPDLTGARPVGPDGRIALGKLGRLRIEGKTVPEAVELIAAAVRTSPTDVGVCVTEYRSQQVYLFGPGIKPQRAVPYQGQETVLDLLQRVGGIAPGAAPNTVYVVRPHIDDAKQPEVFHIDIRAILERHDPRTNIRLNPCDEIHVGETRQACFAKYVPPCLRPLYESICKLTRKIPYVSRDTMVRTDPSPPTPSERRASPAAN